MFEIRWGYWQVSLRLVAGRSQAKSVSEPAVRVYDVKHPTLNSAIEQELRRDQRIESRTNETGSIQQGSALVNLSIHKFKEKNNTYDLRGLLN